MIACSVRERCSRMRGALRGAARGARRPLCLSDACVSAVNLGHRCTLGRRSLITLCFRADAPELQALRTS